MPRPPRENAAGTVHHVYARGVDGVAIFRDDFDRQRYLRMLRDVSSVFSWECLAYCLMTNHVHLLVKTAEPNLGNGVQALHGQYAQKFNRRHERTGHLFQGRYGSTRMTSDEHLTAATRYIARNPVEAGLCASPAEWRWSSFAVADALPGLEAQPSTSLKGV